MLNGQHQQAQGQILPPAVTGTRLKRKKVNYSLANMTYDQAMRILQYETYRELGIDWLNPNLLTQIYGNTALLGSPSVMAERRDITLSAVLAP